MKKEPLTISAIVPCFNSEGTIERCLESILAQTLAVDEILVYDDCSQDRTAEILARMAAKNEKILVFFGGENKGAGYARKTLLGKAQGDVFAFLDSDDIWHPRKLALQVSLMLKKQADIVVCHYDIVNMDGRKIGTRRPPSLITYFKMHLRNEIPTSMAIVRNQVDGCRDMPLIRRRQDYAYWLKIFTKKKDTVCVTVPEVLGTYYRLPGSLSSSMLSNLKANYRMFRTIMGYSILFSTLYLVGNIATRLFRI